MQKYIKVSKIKDQIELKHLKTVNFRVLMKDFENAKTWLIENDNDTYNKIVVIKLINEVLNLCEYDIE